MQTLFTTARAEVILCVRMHLASSDSLFFATFSVFLLYAWANGSSLLMDVAADERGIAVLLFRKFEIKLIPYNLMESVGLRESRPLFTFAYSLRNRMIADALIIDLKPNWFVHSVLVTPADRDDFLATLLRHGVPLRR